jgi:hypothetical protein
MIRDSKQGIFDVVLVWKLDRFSRDRYDSAIYKQTLKKNGVRVVSAKENIAEGPEGIILESLLEGISEYYSAELSVKIRRGHTDNALKCMSNGSPMPLGYKRGENQTFQIDEATAPIVQEIYNRYADGESIKSIISDMDERGIKTSTGRPFTYSSFKTLLKNRKYLGEYRYGDIVTPGGIPAIISEELFDRVQRRQEQNRHAPAKAKAREEYLLTTKLYCGYCGELLVGESGTSKTGKIHYYYKCNGRKRKKKNKCSKKSLPKEALENLVVQAIQGMLLDDATMERVVDLLVETQGKESLDVAVLRNAMADVDRRISNIMKAIEEGIITPTTKERLEALEKDKNDISTKLDLAILMHPVLTREQISYYVYRFRCLNYSKFEDRKILVDTFLNSIYIYDDRMVITFNYRDGSTTIPISLIEGSDLKSLSPPFIPTSSGKLTEPAHE